MSQQQHRRQVPEIRDLTIAATVTHILGRADGVHVVVGPLRWRPTDGLSGRYWYFVVATADPDRVFRCVQINIPQGNEDIGEIRRMQFLSELISRLPLVIHDCDDEVAMARLCESLWPGERISQLRAAVEAEAAEVAGPATTTDHHQQRY